MKNRKISKNTKFSELIRMCPDTIEVLLESGMHCIGCPMSQQETIEQGALAHGIEVEKLVKKLNKVIEGKKR